MICRDAAFWDRIASHPQVAPAVFMGAAPFTLAPVVENEANQPYASQNGGIVFLAKDPAGFVVEMHTLYTPEGWGREVAENARIFMAQAFKRASLVLTFEQEGRPTRPPLSHGWKPCGPFGGPTTPRLRLWSLSREAWTVSPVGRKTKCL